MTEWCLHVQRWDMSERQLLGGGSGGKPLLVGILGHLVCKCEQLGAALERSMV